MTPALPSSGWKGTETPCIRAPVVSAFAGQPNNSPPSRAASRNRYAASPSAGGIMPAIFSAKVGSPRSSLTSSGETPALRSMSTVASPRAAPSPCGLPVAHAANNLRPSSCPDVFRPVRRSSGAGVCFSGLLRTSRCVCARSFPCARLGEPSQRSTAFGLAAPAAEADRVALLEMAAERATSHAADVRRNCGRFPCERVRPHRARRSSSAARRRCRTGAKPAYEAWGRSAGEIAPCG